MPTSIPSKQALTKKPTSFQFLTFSAVDQMKDAAALSRIRRHAMKDIGVQRRKPRKRRFLKIPLEVHADFDMPLQPAIGGGAIHSFLKLPVDELDEVGKGLLASSTLSSFLFAMVQASMLTRMSYVVVFQGKAASAQSAHRVDWFSVALQDPATFHQVLANSELHLEAIRNPHRLPRETPMSIRYHQLALSAVRKMIAKSELTEGLIGAITGMVVYADIAGNNETWLPQRKGLHDVINAREGGIESIERNNHLRATVSWVELRGAYMQDLPSVFPLPASWVRCERDYRSSKTPALLAVPSSRLYESLKSTHPESEVLFDLFNQTHSLAAAVSDNLNESRSSKLTEAEIIICVNVIVHGLLDLRPLNDSTPKLESLRLSLLLFMASVYRQFGATPINTNILLTKLHATLSEHRDVSQFRLWTLCISAFETTADSSLYSWLVAQIATTAEELSLYDVTEMESEMKTTLWIPELMDYKMDLLVREVRRFWE